MAPPPVVAGTSLGKDADDVEVRERVVVITGATSGVGRAAARAFAGRGARIGLLARGVDGLKATRQELEASGTEVIDLPTDVADPDAVEAAAAAIENELGPIRVWVNNAMTSVFSPVKELSAEEIRRVTEVTYLGVVNGSLSALRRMLRRDEGKIVQVGSALAYRAIPLQAAYCGAKHAVEGFTESLRSELLHDRSHVAVTMVHLPALNTPQFDVVKSRLSHRAQPVPPIYQPEVAARAIVWAAEHDRRSVVVGGSTSATILLDKFVPGILDRYLARSSYEAQQTEQPEDPARPFNLWDPISGDRGAHGRFDERSRSRSLQLWATTNRAVIAGALGTMGVAGLAGRRRRGTTG